jgi:hypothetical protein
MTTKLAIINLAMNSLAEKSTNTLDISDIQLQSVSDSYDILKQVLLSKANFKFAILWEKLTLSSETPACPYYKYSYNLPGDLLKIIQTIPVGLDYQIVRNKLNCNIPLGTQPNSGVFISYIANVDESYFTPLFSIALAYKVAADNCMLVTKNENLFQIMEAKAKDALNEAEHFDIISAPNPPISDNPLFYAHAGRIGMGNY